MSTRRLLLCVAAVCLMLTTWGRQAIGAADCGEPTPAPKYQVGEKWTWRDEKGRETTNEVVQVEGDIAQIRWSNGDVASYDKDWIIRKVVRRNGEVITQQGAGAYTTVGQKVLDFPLQVGKKWEYNYTSQPLSGQFTLITYYQRTQTVACEEVSTPAGRFPAIKVEVEQSAFTVYRGSGTYYLWYAPQVKQVVKRQYVPSQWWGGGRFLDNELIKYEGK